MTKLRTLPFKINEKRKMNTTLQYCTPRTFTRSYGSTHFFFAFIFYLCEYQTKKDNPTQAKKIKGKIQEEYIPMT